MSEQLRYELAGRATQVVDRAGRTNTIAYTVAGSVIQLRHGDQQRVGGHFPCIRPAAQPADGA
jgi:hypothetical protein